MKRSFSGLCGFLSRKKRCVGSGVGAGPEIGPVANGQGNGVDGGGDVPRLLDAADPEIEPVANGQGNGVDGGVDVPHQAAAAGPGIEPAAGGAIVRVASSGGEVRPQMSGDEIKERKMVRAFYHNEMENIGKYRAAEHEHVEKSRTRFEEAYRDGMAIRDASRNSTDFRRRLRAVAVQHGEETARDLHERLLADNGPYIEDMDRRQQHRPWFIGVRTFSRSCICVIRTLFGNFGRYYTWRECLDALALLVGCLFCCGVGLVKQRDNPMIYQISACLLWSCLFSFIHLACFCLVCCYKAWYPAVYPEEGPDREERLLRIDSRAQQLGP